MIKELLLASALTGGVAMTNLTAPVQEQPQTAAATEQIELIGEWTFNDTIAQSNSGEKVFHISFESNNIEFDTIVRDDYNAQDFKQNDMYYSNPPTNAYLNGVWTDNVYKTIKIKNIDNLTNRQELETFLTTNATYTPPKPLTPADIFKPITTTATAAMALITGLFTSVINILWTGTELTPIGLITLIPAGIGVVFFAIKFILSAVKAIKVGKKG